MNTTMVSPTRLRLKAMRRASKNNHLEVLLLIVGRRRLKQRLIPLHSYHSGNRQRLRRSNRRARERRRKRTRPTLSIAT